MASSSETGHSKNVANFQTLISRVESLGPAYNPSKTGLQLANLKMQHMAAEASLQNLATALPIYQQAIDARTAAFKSIDKLVTRSLNMFKASVDNPAEAESATSIAKKIRGSSTAKASVAEGDTPVKKVSTSQQSYDMIIANLQVFIEILAAHPAYQPNEPELQVTGLNTLLTDLKSKSQAVIQAQTNVDSARNVRNSLLYSSGNGLVDTGMGVKTYVKAAFTPDTAHYKPILSLEFRNS